VATHTQPAESRRSSPLVIAGLGAAVMASSLALEPKAAAIGAFAFALAIVVAVRESSSAESLLTWPNALVGLVLVVWLIPIRLYRLPVDLPFNLEVYRVAVLVLMLALALALLTGSRQTISAGGHGLPLAALVGVAVVSQMVNHNALDRFSNSPTAFKNLSYFLSFFAIFILVASSIDRVRDAGLILGALTAGGAIVAVAALYESRTRTNLFDNLDNWFPLLDRLEREVLELRGGRLRVRASAQHPIALGVALTMVVPVAVISAQYAATRARQVWWLVGAGLCTFGALVTVSRTVVAMAIVMVAMGLLLRPHQVMRLWPVLLVLPGLAHFAAPGTLGALYKSIFPKEGLVTGLQGRAGLGGSGRLADIDPGLDIWREAPLVGHGLGYVATTTGEGVAGTSAIVEIIFDNQYLGTLVMLGALGLAAMLWFVWGATFKLARTGRRQQAGREADIVAACAVSCAGFAISLVFFDALAYVQVTFVFLVIAAVGLRLRELGFEQAELIPLEPRRTGDPAPAATGGGGSAP
jgi:hypothetical protein